MLCEVAAALRENDSFALLAHVQPDADALGSMLALGMVLEKMGKSVCYCTQGSERLSFLPGYERLAQQPCLGSDPVVKVYLDCATLARADALTDESRMQECERRTCLTINIDHHVSNDGYGDMVWIDSQSSSVGEMLWLLFSELGVGIDDAIAANLYASIVNDTGQFAFHNTTRRTHDVAGALLRHDFGVNTIHKKLFYERSLSQTKLLARALESLCLFHENTVAVMKLTQHDFAEVGVDSDDCEGFVNQAMNISGVLTSMFVKEVETGLCRVSFRSRGQIDVNLLAGLFDGGGHVRASGCTLNMPLTQALPLLMDALNGAVGGKLPECQTAKVGQRTPNKRS
ncbi:MAG: bifunctional oligoribonuclease/PAP phosphatase NrnA [Peptococcaceae bacterium]|nr:bifunctional oligoribonuclease/PAP phosphatase NrnA [Peptococcaceae bacterium]